MAEGVVLSAEVSLGLVLLLVGAGSFGGLLAGLFGVGGGIVFVPVLFNILSAKGLTPADAMSVAVATSLFSIIPTALSSSRAHHRIGNVRWDIVHAWGLPMLFGVLLGVVSITQLRSKFFIAAFAMLMLLIALSKLFRAARTVIWRDLPARWVQSIFAAMIGFISAIAGVGGGATAVPSLCAMNQDIRVAVGTSTAFGLIIAIPGSVGILLFGITPIGAPWGVVQQVYWPALVLLLPFSIFTAPFGARLANRLARRKLEVAFALVLLLVGLQMMGSVLISV